MVMLKPMSYFKLIETFSLSGCAICTLLLKDVDRLLDSLLYERVTESNSHQSFRAARGLCNEHAWQLLNYRGGSLGTAILYRATVDEVLKIIERTPQPDPSNPRMRRNLSTVNAETLSDRLAPTRDCMACSLMSETERDYVEVFSKYIVESQMQSAYQNSDGLCLPHFRLAVKQKYTPDVLRIVITIQQGIWERLHAELTEFTDKNLHERMHEAVGREGDSWKRAIGQMAGAKGVFSVQRRPLE
jgi:hypothetical protein